jgi:hypothetical protein
MKPTIAIFIHDPQCETECALGMIDGLIREFDIRTFGLDNLNIDFISQFDAVCFPGGMGDSDDFHNIFTNEHIIAVQTFVAEGGKYFGICMGAYWAGPYYFDLVTELEVGQYIERPTGDITFEGPTSAEVEWLGNTEWMYFYDGCALVGDHRKFETVATYINNDPMAIFQNRIGLIGCHPESDDYWYDKPYMKKYWHNFKHHTLLLNFVDKLMVR